MSDFTESLIISGSIFAVMMLTQLGRRKYGSTRILVPIVTVAFFGWRYLRDIPSSWPNIAVYAVAVLIGAGFATLATTTTELEKDSTGTIYTVTGKAFIATWLVAMTLRVGFIWTVDNVESFRDAFGEWMIENTISFDAIAPFFVLMALTMVIGRVGAVRYRTWELSRTDLPECQLSSSIRGRHA